MSDGPFVVGKNTKALFSLKIHRGNGMALLAMNWKKGKPSVDFVGFAIEYKEPGDDQFHAVSNRLSFDSDNGAPKKSSSRVAPIQKWRWVHFPHESHSDGEYHYRVTPVFMNERDELSYGDPQEASIALGADTIPGKIDVNFTRGFISSQAFVDTFADSDKGMSTLLPATADKGWNFKPTHPKAQEAYAWMGFEAWRAMLQLLDEAIADKKAQVSVVAYDFNHPEVADKLSQLGKRLRIIIDDSPPHPNPGSSENHLADLLKKSAGADNVKRQHMGQLQHNKTLVINGPKVKAALCGSTNFAWRGLFVQNNHAVVVRGAKAIQPFVKAFEQYWASNDPGDFGDSPSTQWNDLGLAGVKAKVTFSPHSKARQVLPELADDIASKATSSILYSLAFLGMSHGSLRDAITKVTEGNKLFVYGIADKKVGGINLQKTDGNIAPVNPQALTDKDVPEPFKSEPTGGFGTRMHHKFVVIDFDKPTARVYFGSNNMSLTADLKNGENLVLVQDRRVATAFMIEALRIFDHYEFRIAATRTKIGKLFLAKPPRKKGEKPWWDKDYTLKHRIKDRELFSK